MVVIGELALWVALLLAAWGAAACLAGVALRHPPLVASGTRAAYVALASVTLASLGLLTALLGSDFSLAYVASVTAANLPPAYKISAFWAGAAGTRLLWAMLTCGCAVIVLASRGARIRAPLVAGVLLALASWALLALCIGASPYARLQWIPPEGRGLAPPLQHPGAALVQPLLALGYAAGAVPLAHVLAAAVAGPAAPAAPGTVRRWALGSWLCLTSAVLVATWSAYAEVDAGARVTREPAAIVGVVTWLTTTAYLHTGAVSGRRALPRGWGVALLAAAGLLGAAAALLPPSNRSAATALGGSAVWSVALLVAGATGSAYVLVTRRRGAPAVGAPPTPAGGVARYGAHLVHLGFVVLALGAAGLAFRRQHEATLYPGAPFEATDPFGRRWTFVSQGISSEQRQNRDATVVAVEAKRGGAREGFLRGEQRRHFDSRGTLVAEPTAEASVVGAPEQDVRAVLLGVGSGETARLRISFVPFARWIWIGGAVMVAGAVVALLAPAASREIAP